MRLTIKMNRNKRKERPLSYVKMKETFRSEIEKIAKELGLAAENQVDKEDYDMLRGKIIALREMRVKLRLGPYCYHSELWKGVSK